MYRNGAEQKIRKYLVDNNFVDCVIQLPDNLFFGPSISTCILLLKKAKSDTNVLFIDASKEFIKITNNNKLSDDNIEKILNWYSNRVDVPFAVRLAKYDDIVNKKYNLSPSTYVEQEKKKDDIDIDELNFELNNLVKKENDLREKIDNIIKEIKG